MKQYAKAIAFPIISWIMLSLLIIATQGENCSIMGGDFWQQIYPYSIDFWSNLFKGEIQEYSLQYGMGTQMIPTYIYYAINISSLLSYILGLFIPQIWVGIMIQAINAAMLSVGMLIYCRYKFGKDCKWNVVAAVAYSMAGAGIFFSSIATWAFSMGMFPVIMMLFEKLMIADNKDVKKIGSIYAICLGVSIINNILIGYITCLTIVLFFFTQKIISIKDFLNKAVKIATFSIIGALLATPMYISLGGYVQETQGEVSKIATHSDITTFFSNILPATGIYEIDSLTVYTTLPFLIGFVYFLTSKQTNKQEKKENLLRIGILLASLLIFPLQCAWNMFDAPDGLHGRFVFVISFVIIVGSIKYFCQKQTETNKKGIFISITIIAISIIFAIINNSFLSVMLTIVTTSCSIFYLTKHITNPIKSICYFEIILNLFMCICTCGYGTISNTNLVHQTDTLTRGYFDLQKYMHYETELNNIYTYNTFCNKNVRNMFWRFFATPTNNAYCLSYENNQVTLSTMGLQYHIADNTDDAIDVEYFTKTETAKDTTMYSYDNKLSLGYIVPEDILNIDTTSRPEIFLNDYVRATSTVTENYQSNFTNFSYSIAQIGDIFETTITTNEDVNNIIYTCLNDRGGELKSKPVTNIKAGETIKITTKYEVQNVTANRFNTEVFEKWYSDISKEQLLNANWNHDTFTGDIKSSKDNSLLMVTIGYSKNFKAYIDEQETEIIPLLDNMFIGIRIPEGEHQIKLIYHEKELPIAAAVQTVVLLSLITIIITEKYRTRGMEQK